MIDSKNNFKKEIELTIEEIKNILIKKNEGYGNAFYLGMEEIKKSFPNQNVHLISFFSREIDKLQRFLNLIKKSDEEKSIESITDSVLDIAGYAILMLNYLKYYE